MENIAVLVEEGYEDLEFWYPKLRLKEEGFDVVGVGRRDKKYSSKHGYTAVPEKTISEVSASNFDGVVVPGGRKCPDLLRTDDRILDFVGEIYDRGGTVGAICHGPWVLISAGVVKGHEMTCYKSIKDDLVNAGADYFDRKVVVSDNIVTSRMPSDLPDFMESFLSVLS